MVPLGQFLVCSITFPAQFSSFERANFSNRSSSVKGRLGDPGGADSSAVMTFPDLVWTVTTILRTLLGTRGKSRLRCILGKAFVKLSGTFPDQRIGLLRTLGSEPDKRRIPWKTSLPLLLEAPHSEGLYLRQAENEKQFLKVIEPNTLLP